MSFINSLKRHRNNSRLISARQAHEDARRKWAEVESEVTFANRMAVFYGDELRAVNHETDWWRYAELKQKQHDALESADRYTAQARELYAKATARGEEVKRLESGDAVVDFSRCSPAVARRLFRPWVQKDHT